MALLSGDFETYYDSSYTLKKLTTEAYIRNDLFEPLTFCGYWPETDQEFQCIGRDEISAYIADIDWANTTFLSHHSQFDGLILSHHYKAFPQALWCTLSMARGMGREKLGSKLSLDALTQRLKLPVKNVDYGMFKGKRFEELTERERYALAAQCLNDSNITYDLFLELLDMGFPHAELTVIDQTVKMFTKPMLVGDVAHFQQMALTEMERKERLLRDLNIDRHQLTSNTEFQVLLEGLGVDVAFKQGKKGPIPAFAKTDNFMRELLDSEDEAVRAVAEARLDVKSTIVETRAGRMADIASRGPIPIYLNYCGASTLRWSGGDKQNSQNFSRKGQLRAGITAPKGHKLIIVDERQIEARILLRIANQWDQLQYFIDDKDIYKAQAMKVYGKAEADIDSAERGTGKQLVLSCGYGSGARTIQRTARLGVYGPPQIIDIETAELWKTLYRETNPNVVKLWWWAEDVLRYMISDDPDKEFPDNFAPPIWPHGEDKRQLLLPNGLALHYEDLKYTEYEPWEADQVRQNNFFLNEQKEKIYYKEFILPRGHERRKIYGSIVVQNLCEAFARIVISDAMIRIRKTPALKPVHIVMMAHDELVFCCPDELVDNSIPLITGALTETPKWLPDLPLAVEVKVSDKYEK